MPLESVTQSFQTAKEVLEAFMTEKNLDRVSKLARMMAGTLGQGGKILSCGNGGSMCDAMHFAEELTGRFHQSRRALAAMAISDPSHISCTANDFGYDFIFSRYVEAHGKEGDILLGLSTSGNSPNVIKAVEVAKEMGIFTVCLLGKDGGKLKSMADLPIVVPAETSDRIQEVHIKIIHSAIEATEKILSQQGLI